MARLGLEEIRYQARRRGKKITLKKNELRRYIDEAAQTLAKDSIIDLIIRDYGVDITLNRVEDSMVVDNITKSISAKDSSLDSKFLSKGSLDIELESVKLKSKEVFFKEVIKPSLVREDQTTAFLRQNLSTSIRTKEDVLNYFNNKTAKPAKLPTLEDVGTDLINRYTQFLNRAKEERTLADFQALSNTILNKFEDLKNVLEQKIVEFPQFIGYWNAFMGTLDSMLKLQAEPNLEQLKKSTTTFLEAVEMARLIIGQTQLALDPNEVEITIESTGSQPSAFLQGGIKKYLQSTSKEVSNLTLKDYNTILVEMFQRNPEALVGKNKTTQTTYNKETAAIAQTTISTSGSATDTTVADIAYIITNKKTKTRRAIYIDAKLSGETGGRYTPSSGITTTTQNILDNSLDTTLRSQTVERLQIVLSYLIYLALKGDLDESYFKSSSLNTLVTYALLGSQDFVKHYRQYIATENTGFAQPDLLALRTGYIWYSDLFRAAAYRYFEQGGGSRVSFQIKSNMDVLLNPFDQSVIDFIRSKREEFTMVQDLQKTGIIEQQLLDSFQIFLRSNVKYGLDISNLEGLLKKAGNYLKNP